MAGTAESILERRGAISEAHRGQGAVPPYSTSRVREMAAIIRALALDAVTAAKSGHPGIAMGMADAATALWTRFLKFDAADPAWPDRDRFVLSDGHGSMLLYALLHLTGHSGMGVAELRRFRQLHSPASGHPDCSGHPAIEATTGPLGQGIATAVGLALAERMLAARFGKSLVDHRTWVIASDGDLMEGVSHEAIGLAGHLRLEKLTVLFDEGSPPAGGEPARACSEDLLKRFAAQGWTVKRVDGHDPLQIAAALSFAVRARKPALIACQTALGLTAAPAPGAPHADATPGAAEAAAAKAALGWDAPPFVVPPDIAARWIEAGTRGAGVRRAWLKRLAHHPMRAEFERAIAGRLPDAWRDGIAALKAEFTRARPRLATGQASQKALGTLAPAIPDMIGGSTDLTGSTLTYVKGLGTVSPGGYGGRYVHFGVREHGMAACLNGLALHGGFIPYGGTYFAFSDYMRPALRLAALMRLRVIHVLTHDSIGLGEDGPTHQPIEHLASLRAMPNMCVFRPADAIETAECWELALRRTEGPSLLALTRQALPLVRAEAADNRSARGGYVLAEAEGARQATLLATGSEVAIALSARAALAEDGIATAVVSLPCWELFAAQDEAYRAEVLGAAPRIGIEAASPFGWERWLGENGTFIGMTGFGASAPCEDLYRHFGITPEAIMAAVRKRLGQAEKQGASQ